MSDVSLLDYGLYLLNSGDTASSVARRVYGDVHKGSVLLGANDGSWEDLEHVKVPNKKGRCTTVRDGDSVQLLIERMFPNQPVSIYMQPFFMWNGGDQMKLLPGDVVFVPER